MTDKAKLFKSIVARGVPLWDRHPANNRSIKQNSLKQTRLRIKKWRAILGNSYLLNKRLKCAGITPKELNALLTSSSPIPSSLYWVNTFSAILDFYQSRHNKKIKPRSFDSSLLIPFQEVLWGFVEYAHNQLKRRKDVPLHVLSSSAVKDIERQLLSHLSFTASMALGQDFYKFRFDRAPASAFEAVWATRKPTTEIYKAFIADMNNGSLINFFDTYPVLARLLSQSVDQWIVTIASFCTKFSEDFVDLKQHFGFRVLKPRGAILHLRTGLSDRHYGGQEVFECILSSQEKIIYKPRSVLPEISFYRFIERINAFKLSLQLKTICILNKQTHGWVQAIEALPCNNHSQLEKFYTRMGMLLALLHALAVTDIHFENLIASGEHPVVVDLETLLDEVLTEKQKLAINPKNRPLFSAENSVLRTGLLPMWQIGPGKHRYDLSAIGADDKQYSGLRIPSWQNTNTDQMVIAQDSGSGVLLNHRTKLGSKLLSPATYLPSILRGFKKTYSCLLANRKILLADPDLLQAFDNLDLRILLRSTENYVRLQMHMFQPQYLQDGLDRSIEMDWLARPLCGTEKPEKSRTLIYEMERLAMEDLDIPHFTSSDWCGVQHISREPELLLLCRQRDSQTLRRRLLKLSIADRDKQLTIIKNSFHLRFQSK